MDNILISVIIPFYSHLEWLEEALDSVYNQTYKNIEIIVINDGSTENVTNFLLKNNSKIKYIFQKNKGAAAARNLGINIASGDYISFLDSDDLWKPNKIEKQLEFMENNNEVLWSITAYELFDDLQKKIIRVKKCKKFSGLVFPKILYNSPIATPTVMIRKEFCKNNQLRFEENLKYGEDSCLWIKLSLISKLGNIDEPLTSVRWRGTNAASNIKEQILSRVSVYQTLTCNDSFISRKSEISKIALNCINYCKWIGDTIIAKGFINKLLLSLLYFPARLSFKILSLIN